jgi:MFS transporter, PAT family, solute carrier family 33 (acetyl-CoA transportor), member 1
MFTSTFCVPQGIFAIAAYPYSLKLLWSPIVDTFHSPRLGRRKSWIIPTQGITALILFFSAQRVEDLVHLGGSGVTQLTGIFLALITLAATQDIAVDGWAIELLEGGDTGYGSTCQTVGMTIGWFLSYTFFLAASDPAFCANQLSRFITCPASGLISIADFMRGSAMVLAVVTGVVLFWPDRPLITPASDPTPSTDLVSAYTELWAVLQLPAVRQLSMLLLVYRLAFSPVEIATALKLVDRGVSRETVAGVNLLMTPVEMAVAVLAGRLAVQRGPGTPFAYGMGFRFLACAGSLILVAGLGSFSSPWAKVAVLTGVQLIATTAQTLMFTSQGALFAAVSDPRMGGAYLTLLNTVANLGYTLPKVALFWLMDKLTLSQCHPTNWPMGVGKAVVWTGQRLGVASEKWLTQLTQQCETHGTLLDGYYVTGVLFLFMGLAFAPRLVHSFRRLSRISTEHWRVKLGVEGKGRGGKDL